MSSVSNVNESERAKIFETVFSAPGMKETCKIVLNPSRQTILLLSHLIEQELVKKQSGEAGGIVAYLSKETLEELRLIFEELLKKSELTEFYERLKHL